MQDRRLKVVDVDVIFGDVESEIVGGSKSHAGFYSAACKPDSKRLLTQSVPASDDSLR